MTVFDSTKIDSSCCCSKQTLDIVTITWYWGCTSKYIHNRLAGLCQVKNKINQLITLSLRNKCSNNTRTAPDLSLSATGILREVAAKCPRLMWQLNSNIVVWLFLTKTKETYFIKWSNWKTWLSKKLWHQWLMFCWLNYEKKICELLIVEVQFLKWFKQKKKECSSLTLFDKKRHPYSLMMHLKN